MRAPLIALGILAALAVPAATAASAASPDASSGIVLVADGPVVFSPPTASCPLGIATATVTVLGTGEQAVSTACGKKAASCGGTCQRFKLTYDVPLAGGDIRSSVMQRQIASGDGRTIGVTVQGSVSKATGSYAGLVGAPVNGGGALVVQNDGSVLLRLTTAITPAP